MDKKGVTNRVITYLAIFAIFITLFGVTFSLVKTGNIEFPFITGLAASATVTGKVNITIAKTISISLNTSLVDFNNGSTSASPAHTAVNTTAATNPNTFAEPYPIVVRNDGNTDVNLTLNGSTAAQFFPGATNPSYMWNASENETNSCGGNDADNISGAILSVTNTHAVVCSNLTFDAANDEVKIDIYLNLSPDTPPGLEYRDDGLQIVGEERHPSP